MVNTRIGRWAFIVAGILAILAGAISSLGSNPMVAWVLAILGLVVGFLNVSERETTGFLVATIALLLSASTLGPLLSNAILTDILGNIARVAGPAAFVVAIKHLYATAQD